MAYNEIKTHEVSATPEIPFSSTIYPSLDLTSPVLMELRQGRTENLHKLGEEGTAGVGEESRALGGPVSFCPR